MLVNSLKAERDAAVEEKIKHISQLGATSLDAQKQVHDLIALYLVILLFIRVLF